MLCKKACNCGSPLFKMAEKGDAELRHLKLPGGIRFHFFVGVLYNSGKRKSRPISMPMNEVTRKSIEQVVEECGRYPLEAFEFVRHGLNYTVHRIHGPEKAKSEQACHVSGQQLSWGLRNYAVHRYGLMARAVLEHWGILRTGDFGRIVFAMVDSKLMQKTEEDDVRDFDNVFSFDKAFEPPMRPQVKTQVKFAL